MKPSAELLAELSALVPKVSSWARSQFLDAPVLRGGCSPDELLDFAGALQSPLPETYRNYLGTCREFQADGPGPPVYLFPPFTVLAYAFDASTPNRLLDAQRGFETHVITVGLYDSQLLLLETRGESIGRLLYWPPGETVRFDGSAADSCVLAFDEVGTLLQVVLADWKVGLGHH